MVVVVPMTFMQLPALLKVVIVRVVPVSSLVGRLVPPSGNPPVAMPVGLPIAVNPGIAGAGSVPTSFVAEGRRRASDVQGNLREAGDGESRHQ
jgi:hypothetical protein